MKHCLTVLFIVLLFIAGDSHAGWQIRPLQGAESVRNNNIVYITSKENHVFFLMWKPNGVWGYLKLEGSSMFQEHDSLMVTIDRGDPFKYSDNSQSILSSVGISVHDWKPKQLGFLMWHGSTKKGCGIVGEILNGKYMNVRYHPQGKDYQDIIFNISENKDVIRQVFNVKSGSCSSSS